MDLKEMYREIVNEHNLHPEHKHDLDNPSACLQGINPSCGDDIELKLKIENGVITDGSFIGSGCAISQASTDMMLDLLIGQSKEEADKIIDVFLRMIKGEASEEEIESLDEAAALQNISFMPARVKCAQLGWNTMKKIIDEDGK